MGKDKVSREEIESRVKQVIANTTNVDIEKIKPDLHLQNDLGIDSFTAIEMIYNAEDEFGISIADDELAKLGTVNDIVEIVQEKLKK